MKTIPIYLRQEPRVPGYDVYAVIDVGGSLLGYWQYKKGA